MLKCSDMALSRRNTVGCHLAHKNVLPSICSRVIPNFVAPKEIRYLLTVRLRVMLNERYESNGHGRTKLRDGIYKSCSDFWWKCDRRIKGEGL